MKKVFSAFALLALPCIAFAQLTLSGTVKSTRAKILPGAVITVDNTYYNVQSDANGKYQLRNLKAGSIVLHADLLGYEKQDQTVQLESDQTLDITLQESKVMVDEVVIEATRADERSGVAYTNIDKQQIEQNNLGQDVPYLLNQTPSVVVASDAGAGVGYTGIRIRGTDASRINVTINGIPVNDAESQGTYWVDLPDIASSIDNIQVQRGVGTSTNGAGAFGGSLNIQTTRLNAKPYAEVNNSYGSFATMKNTVLAGSGLIDSAWAFDTRLSKIKSNGYIDRASSDLGSYYLSGAYYGKNTIIKAITFSGIEETYQAWYGVPQDSLKTNRTFNPAGMYLDEAGNIKYYDNQVDHYKQDYYQLHFSRMVSSSLNINAALHYTKGAGYYEEFNEDASLSDYGLDDVVIDSLTTITSTDLVRRKWLDNDFYGITFSANYDARKKLALTLGGGWNRYEGDHFGEIVWAQHASNSHPGDKYYNDNALKTDFNVFAKVNYAITSALNVFADVQYRLIDYSFLGFNSDLDNVTQSVQLSFVNPKAGLTYLINDHANVYASYSVGNKEPNRDDYTQSTPGSRPRPETLNDIELGYRHNMKKAAWSINAYYMMYKDQLVLTGEVNDVGAYNRSNVDKSYRAGIEAEFGWKILSRLEWAGNVTLSRNKISSFREYIDDYDNSVQQVNEYSETDIAFSPNLIVASVITYSPFKGAEVSLFTKHVGKQYLDNTSNESRKIDAYITNDIRAGYSFRLKHVREISVSLMANNILNEMYSANGYTFSYVYGGEFTTENYYYPQAGFNWRAGLSLKF